MREVQVRCRVVIVAVVTVVAVRRALGLLVMIGFKMSVRAAVALVAVVVPMVSARVVVAVTVVRVRAALVMALAPVAGRSAEVLARCTLVVPEQVLGVGAGRAVGIPQRDCVVCLVKGQLAGVVVTKRLGQLGLLVVPRQAPSWKSV